MSQFAFQLRQLLHRMWFLPLAFSLLAVLTVAGAYALAGLAPPELPFTMPSDAVVSILGILASSLLTVAVFALSTIVSALSTASSSTTPRAVPLIVGDRSAQVSISVFIGAFLFAVVGLIGLNSGIYSEAGRLLLFVVTLLVVVLVVAALIRWIGQISAIGRVGETIDRVEAATLGAFAELEDGGLFGCRPLRGDPKGYAVSSEQIGYVQHFDAARLQALAEAHDLRLAVAARPGTFATPDRPLLYVDGTHDAERDEELAQCFSIGDVRTYDSDPRFGLVVLGEIASKALSPGINDPGTAIDVIGTLVRVFNGRPAPGAAEVVHDRIAVSPLAPRDLLEDAFRPIARDGAGTIEVVQRLLTGLQTLAATRSDLAPAIADVAADVIERADAALTATSDRRALREAASGFPRAKLSN